MDKVVSGEEIGDITVGTPSAVFLPARPHKFVSDGRLHRVAVPVRGKFPDDSEHPFSGEDFDVIPSGNTLLFGDLLKIMFASEAYPALADNERFVIYSIETYYDRVVIVGEVIKMLED